MVIRMVFNPTLAMQPTRATNVAVVCGDCISTSTRVDRETRWTL
jgi:hypothetical protein